MELGAVLHATLEAAAQVRAPASFRCADGEALRAQHRKRALDALAMHRSTTDLTNGFCAPSEGRCGRQSVTGRNCIAQAEGLLKAIEGRGMSVVWDHDPNLIVTMEKRP
jgi:hypothetical protein